MSASEHCAPVLGCWLFMAASMHVLCSVTGNPTEERLLGLPILAFVWCMAAICFVRFFSAGARWLARCFGVAHCIDSSVSSWMFFPARIWCGATSRLTPYSTVIGEVFFAHHRFDLGVCNIVLVLCSALLLITKFVLFLERDFCFYYRAVQSLDRLLSVFWLAGTHIMWC